MVNETNDTKNNTPAAYLVAEVCYCMAFFMLKKLLEQKILSPEICQQINVAVAVQNKLDRLNREFDRLLLLNGDEENVFLEKKLQKINNEILSLKQEVKYTERQNVQNRDKMDKLREVMELLSAENMEITEYSDVLVCRLIEQITVLSKTEIRIRFVGGYEVEQKLLI